MSATNPPRHRHAEDLSGRARAARRGALTQSEFLQKMRFIGYVPVPGSIENESPMIDFTHPVLADRHLSVRPLENFSDAFERMAGELADMVVVKLQKPLSSTLGELWLAYPQNRAWQVLMPRATVPLRVRKVVDETFKSFFYAKRIGDSHALMFGGQAPDQRW